MIPILYESTLEDATFITNGICRLSDVLSCTVVEERNGEYTLELEYPLDGLHADEITVQRIIKAKANDRSDLQCFRIARVTKTLDGKKLAVSANHISYDLSYFPVAPFEATVNSVAFAITAILNNSVNTSGFYNQSDYDPGDAITFKVNEPKSIRACLAGSEGSVLDRYHGEYEWDNRLIKWHENRGSDNGVTITYGKNLTSYEQETNIAEVYCGILPYFKSEDTVVYGDIQYSSNAADFPFPKSVVMDFSSDFDPETPPTVAQLNAKAVSYINANGVGTPKVSFDVSFFPLWQDPEYKAFGELDRVALCDTVTVQFTELGVRAKAKVVKTTYNSLLERYDSIELGSIKANIADTIAGLMTSSGSASGTGSTSGGADTVVDEGTDGNWTYRKWSSGISECWGYYDVSNVACTTASGSLYVTGAISPSMAFPSGVFKDDSTLNVQMLFHSVSGTPAFVWVAASASPSVGATPFRLMRPTSTTINGRMEYSYKGRWK